MISFEYYNLDNFLSLVDSRESYARKIVQQLLHPLKILKNLSK